MWASAFQMLRYSDTVTRKSFIENGFPKFSPADPRPRLTPEPRSPIGSGNAAASATRRRIVLTSDTIRNATG